MYLKYICKGSYHCVGTFVVKLMSTYVHLELIYRVSIKSLYDYKHLIQENYLEYKNNIC
jgi:hypothetical protein